MFRVQFRPKAQYSLRTIVLTTFFVAIALAPVNRNTAEEIWFRFIAPQPPTVCTGAHWVTRHYYGETWISRYKSCKAWLFPTPQLTVAPRVIVFEEDD